MGDEAADRRSNAQSPATELHEMKLISTERYRIIRQAATETFDLIFAEDKRTQKKEFILQSKSGKHRAHHSFITLLDQQGKVIGEREIDDDVAEFILKHFHLRGDTESFFIYEDDLVKGGYAGLRKNEFNPTDVRHVVTKSEKSYTSNGAKLWYHKPIFDKLRDTNFASIIRATMTLHQVCASRCQFCSTIARNKKDTTTLQEAIDFVDSLYSKQAQFNAEQFGAYNDAYRLATGSDIRLRGLILSGGGQPNLWPDFEDFVRYLTELDIDLGLITNGFPSHVPEDVYESFKWIRISVTPEDASPFYPNHRFDLQYLPDTIINNPDVTVGLSYVFGPWTTDDILLRIDRAISKYGFSYCRMLTDCNLTRDLQLSAHAELSDRLLKLNFIDNQGNPTRKIFHQLKYHGTESEANEIWDTGQCFLQAYNVFWDTTGHEENGHSFCFPCDSVTVLTDQLADGSTSSSERRFNVDRWGTVLNTEVAKLYTEPLRPYFDPREACSSCLFMDNNRVVKAILSDEVGDESRSGDEGLTHLNFP